MRVKRKDPIFEVMYFAGSVDSALETMKWLQNHGYLYKMSLLPGSLCVLEPVHVKNPTVSDVFSSGTYIVMTAEGPLAMSADELNKSYEVVEDD